MRNRSNIYGKLKTATWIAGFLVLILGGYVRWGLPHGPMINIGEECTESDDGRSTFCGDRYVEDTRQLNIPGWAKFMRDEPSTVILGFLLLAIFFEYKLKDDEDTWPKLRN